MTPIHPKFGNPPLFEQAIAVVFEAIPQFSIGDFGLFWTHVQGEFPTSEAHAAVEPTIERFEGPSPRSYRVQLIPPETLPRCFFRHRDGSELIQLQADRFGFNWLKQGGGKYPHSEATVARFFELFSKFEAFCEERGFPTPAVRQCEITNVNIIPDTELRGAENNSAYFARIPDVGVPNFLKLESVSYNVQQMIVDEQGHSVGRLYEAFSPAYRTDTKEQAHRLELTARGAPAGSGRAGLESFFALARSAINGAFLASTTREAHKSWGYNDGNRI